MRLATKKYNRQEINEFKEKASVKNMEYVLENISCFRLLGWKLILPLSIMFNTQGFGDVIKFQDVGVISINKDNAHV